jgi:hypothetical protein
MKLCSDCKHYQPLHINYQLGEVQREACLNPGNASVVDGSPRESPETLRYRSIVCGMDALWWEPKDAECSTAAQEHTDAK